MVKAPKSLLRLVGRSLHEYRMIRDGDRILLGVSGGKDSLSLFHVLQHFQRHAPINFSLAAATVNPQVAGFDPSPLKAYFAAQNTPYHFINQALVEQANQSMQGDSFCSFCSRMKRGVLYRVCREEGYNVLALGQHLDDLAESFLMSAFRGGQLRTMKAHYLNDAGDVRVIRPLVRVRESQTQAFAQAANLPVIVDNCPACFSKPTERQRMKMLLQAESQNNPQLFSSLATAMKPLLTTESLP
jgi:tRNA(Ile)-lysidine synthase TilS/MesJ